METLVRELVIELASGKGDPMEFLQSLRDRISEAKDESAEPAPQEDIGRCLDRIEEDLARIVA